MTTGELVTAPQSGGLISREMITQVQHLADVSKEVKAQLIEHTDPTVKAFVMAEGLAAIEAGLTTELMDRVMRLMNNPLGFVTDRPPGAKNKDGKPISYSVAQVKPVVVQALVRGLRLHGNEWNILVGNLYVAKAGIIRLVEEFPGVTDFDVSEPSIPKSNAGGAVVEMSATWKQNGEPHGLECVGDVALPVRVNAGMGAQAIQGKAIRQFYNRIWTRLIRCEAMSIKTGELGDVDSEPVAVIGVGDTEIELHDKADDGPSLVEQYQHHIAECADENDIEAMKEVLVTSKQLSDDDRSGLAELLAVKAKRIQERARESAKE